MSLARPIRLPTLAALLVAVGLVACGAPASGGGETAEPSEHEEITAAPGEDWCEDGPRDGFRRLAKIDVGSDWFEVYELGYDVYAICEPHQFEEAISYLILGDERALLFDTGLGVANLRDVVEQLTPLPVNVINSHTHFDHVGGNAEFDRVYGLDLAYTEAHARGLPHREVAGAVAPEALCRELPGGMQPEDYRIRPWRIDRFVRNGEILGLGGRSLRVITTPGHTPDSLMLHDADRGLLFTGDSFYEGPIYLFAPETDLADYRRSIAQVARLVPDLEQVLGGHNVPLSDPALLADLDVVLGMIERGEAEPQDRGDHLEYDFSFRGFTVLLPK